MRLSGVKSTGRRVVSEFSRKNVPLMAAGIAYYAFVSLAPLLLLFLMIVSYIGGGLQERMLSVLQQSLPTAIADVVTVIFQNSSARAGASIVSLVVLVWGALKVFRGLDNAVSEIYESTGHESLVDQLKDGILVLFTLILAGLATAGVGALFATFTGSIPYFGVLTPFVLSLSLVVVFFPIYYFLPDVEQSWRSVLPGVVFAAVGWGVLQIAFQVYISLKGGSSGIFGGIILLLTWLYFSGLVILVGALINAILGGYASETLARAEAISKGGNVRRERTLSGEDRARYLDRLRSRFAKDARGTDRPAPVGPQEPSGDVDLLEFSNTDGSEEAVLLRWDTDGADGDEEIGADSVSRRDTGIDGDTQNGSD